MHESWCHANPPPQWIDDHKKDREHGVMEESIAWRIQETLLVGVVSEMKRGPTNPERMKALAKVN